MTTDKTFAEEIFGFPYISDREMASERLVFNTTEDILLAMQDTGITKRELAKKLGKSASHVSQLLDGTRNMTLKTLSDISYALGAEAKVVILKNGCDVSHPVIPAHKHYVMNLNSFMDEPSPVIKITIKPQNRDYEINVA